MKLELKTPHLSLKILPPVELPDFTLITGVNGAGKTHLLRAIESKRVIADIAPQPATDIKYFDWNNLIPNDAGQSNPADVYSERDNFLQLLSQMRGEHEPSFVTELTKCGNFQEFIGNPWQLLNKSESDLAALSKDSAEARSISKTLETTKNQIERRIKSHFRGQPALLERLERLSTETSKSISLLAREDFDRRPFGWHQVDLFQHSFARMFLTYFELEKTNKLKKLDNDAGKIVDTPLTDDEFIAMHGKPPWEFINKVLEQANLDFRIDHPVAYTTTQYSPRLTKITSGAEVSFGALSSGEKVLMSFAFCLYYSVDKRQSVTRPKLLLLDEIDAPLHPSMCKMVVNTIKDTLVGEHGIKVVLATHSPSTVAVAPEASLYVMRPNESGVHKVGKRQAIAILTTDIPTLSISFHGQRQVFVESDLDAERYATIYRCLSPYLQSERSLVFIGVGRKKPHEADREAGCPQVEKIVNALANAGNESVFGLIDWDTKNLPNNRIYVLGAGERYSIENCLLDPLLVAVIAVRTNRQFGSQLGFKNEETVFDLHKMDAARLQTIVDNVQRRVLELDQTEDVVNLQPVEYRGNFKLNISQQYLHMPGHKLESAIKDKFPFLQKFHKEGELLRQMIDPIIVEFQRFTPTVLFSSLLDILNSDVN